MAGLSVTFLLFVLPYAWMPDVRDTPWQELARGVAEGDEGAHEPDAPYFILGTNEPLATTVAVLKSRVMAQGWRLYENPDVAGGMSFDRADAPGKLLVFDSFVAVTSGKFPLEDMQDYSVSIERLRGWQSKYANVYLLEIVLT